MNPVIGKVSSVYVLEHSRLVIRCFPMADSQLILELLFLHIRGGCSLTVLLFFLMLVGICCFILSASLCVVPPTRSYVPSFTSARKFINYTPFWVVYYEK